MISEQVVLSEQLVKDTQKTITELLKFISLILLIPCRQFFQNMGCRIGKGKTKQFAVDLKVAENSVADSEKLLMNQTFDIKVFEDKKILLKSVN
jgi:exonuclease SbcC